MAQLKNDPMTVEELVEVLHGLIVSIGLQLSSEQRAGAVETLKACAEFGKQKRSAVVLRLLAAHMEGAVPPKSAEPKIH